MAIKPKHAFLPKQLQQHVGDNYSLEQRREKRKRARWKRRHEQDKPGAKIKHKTTFRIEAENEKGILTFFKIRTKRTGPEIKRLLSRSHLKARRVSI